MGLMTPLARVLGTGSAKEGTGHWWWQRLTAIALVPLGLWFVVSLLTLVGSDHGAAVQWLRSPLQAALMVLFVAVAFWHAILGLQVVVEDYVHAEGTKFAVLIAIKLIIALCTVVAILLILRTFLGA